MKPPAIRPPDDIAADIVRELRPLKPGARGVMTAEILVLLKGPALQYAAQMKPYDAATKKVARNLALALAAFGKKLPNFRERAEWFWWADATASAIAYGQGPDPRFDFPAYTCAMLARTLVMKFSQQKSVKSENGNLHLITKLLMEAGGRPHAGGLRAVKALPPR